MIRVNLLRNKVNTSAPMTAAQVSVSASSESNRELITKIIFLSIFTAGLIVYESQNIRSLNEERARVDAAVSQLDSEAAAKATEVEAIKDVAKQAQELEDKLKILKLLSKLRLREVKTLDFMQSSIPEKVWLKNVRYEAAKDTPEAKADVEAGTLGFEGNAVNTEDLSEFVKRLEDSAYLSEVIVVKNQETTAQGRSNTYREFLFNAQVEVKK